MQPLFSLPVQLLANPAEDPVGAHGDQPQGHWLQLPDRRQRGRVRGTGLGRDRPPHTEQQRGLDWCGADRLLRHGQAGGRADACAAESAGVGRGERQAGQGLQIVCSTATASHGQSGHDGPGSDRDVAALSHSTRLVHASDDAVRERGASNALDGR